ncbi:hypothetical protein LTR08_003832 [Meristemomyces frigidus]|nr:hypothetical protein LTR08_003832 [Meristemomyces frigidus]
MQDSRTRCRGTPPQRPTRALPCTPSSSSSKSNFGALEFRRYFFAHKSDTAADSFPNDFVEVKEQDLIEGVFSKVNTFKNFKFAAHNRFYELNSYKRDPVNKHHWRADVARPGSEIDL